MSQRYEYSVGLRIHHPSVDPRAISRGLRMRPRWTWRVGEPRMTPTGTPLPGLRQETYWSKTITPGGVKAPSGGVAEAILTKLLKRLRPHRKFLRSLRNSGGNIELWLSAHSTSNYSFVFPPVLIGLIHDLGCKVVVDVYPYRQNWGK
jgi:hypothetical protein